MAQQVIVSESHRALLFRDGRFETLLEPGRYTVAADSWWRRLFGFSVSSVVPIDIRHRELTIKGQEILTADKVAIRVSILVQYRVTDPKAAVLTVDSYADRIYSDVQLAARRSLAGMTFEEILTNRTRLSEEILQDVQESATSYGVEIHRADVKDLIFPGNLQEVMNRVLTAERLSQAELVEARTRAEKNRIEALATATIDAEIAAANAEALRLRAESEAEATRLRAQTDAEAKAIAVRAEIEAAQQRRILGEIYAELPSLVRVEELTALRELAKYANARIYIGFDKHAQDE